MPPVIVPPVIIPPVLPPCEEGVDEECTPEEPPVDAPEPGLLLLLMLGVVTYGAFQRKAMRAP